MAPCESAADILRVPVIMSRSVVAFGPGKAGHVLLHGCEDRRPVDWAPPVPYP